MTIRAKLINLPTVNVLSEESELATIEIKSLSTFVELDRLLGASKFDLEWVSEDVAMCEKCDNWFEHNSVPSRRLPRYGKVLRYCSNECRADADEEIRLWKYINEHEPEGR